MISPRDALRRGALAAALVGAFAGSSSTASAAGFAAARFGGEQGSVVTTNPTALYYNPAGIGFSDGTHLYLAGNLALRQMTWTRSLAPTDLTDVPNAQAGNTGQARMFNVFGGPAAGATTRFGKFAVGLGLF